MKYIYLLILCCFAYHVEAQITIDSNDLPQAGIIHTLAVGNGNLVDLGTASADAQTWDFTAMTPFAIKEFSFNEAEELAGFEDYPNAIMGRTTPLLDALGVSLGGLLALPIPLPDANSFYGNNAEGGLDYLGIHTNLNIESILEGDSASITANPPLNFYPTGTYGDNISGSTELFLSAPVNENIVDLIGADDIDLDSLGLDLSIIDAGILIEVDSDVNIDAYGTLNIHNASYEVLRFKDDLNVRLSVGAYLGPIQLLNLIDTTVVATQYRFWAKNENQPVVTMLELFQDGALSIVSSEFLYTPSPLNADFIWEPTSNGSAIIQFSDNSQGDGLTYSWDFGDGSTSMQPNPIHNYQIEEDQNFTVTLTITDLLGNSTTTSELVSIIFTSEENLSLSEFNLFPNPARDMVNVELPSNWQQAQVRIFDMNGKLVSTEYVNNNERFNVSKLPSGNYSVEFNNGKESISKQLIIE